MPLRVVAIVSGVFGFTCLCVLVVVTSVDNKDALATVALALAILAFGIQLIVFIAQQGLATEQGRRSEQIYGEMRSVLAEIREKAAGTENEVRRIGDRTERMLLGDTQQMGSAVLSKNLADAAGGKVDFQRLASDLERTISKSEDDEGAEAQDDRLDFWPVRRQRSDDEAVIQELESYPDPDEAGRAFEVLDGLSPDARERLKSFGEDEIRARQPESPLDPSLIEDEGSELESKGLIEPHPEQPLSPDEPRFVRLTDQGRQVARLLTANGEPPEYLPELEKIREETPDRFPNWPGRDEVR